MTSSARGKTHGTTRGGGRNDRGRTGTFHYYNLKLYKLHKNTLWINPIFMIDGQVLARTNRKKPTIHNRPLCEQLHITRDLEIIDAD